MYYVQTGIQYCHMWNIFKKCMQNVIQVCRKHNFCVKNVDSRSAIEL